MVRVKSLEESNAYKHIGMEIVENELGQLGIRIKDSDNLKQVYGSVHGGIIAMAIDASMAVAVNEAIGPDKEAVTVELKVNYLRPIKDSDLYAFAKLVKHGRQLLTSTSEVYDSEKRLIAIGSSTFMITK